MRIKLWIVPIALASLLIGGSSCYLLASHWQDRAGTGGYQKTQLLPYRGLITQTPTAKAAG
jgi:hypothetical protein